MRLELYYSGVASFKLFIICELGIIYNLLLTFIWTLYSVVMLQITGDVDAVRKALQSVSQQLIENPPRDHDSFPLNTTGQSSHSFGPRPEVHPPPNHSFSSQGAPFAAGPRDVEIHSPLPSRIPGRMMPSLEMLTFRLLCHDERVGGVIGKGGAIIKTLKQETGCEIKVLEAIPDSEDRIIVISSPMV